MTKDKKHQGIYKYTLNNNLTTTEDGEYVSILQWIQQQIDKSPDNTIRMKIVDIKKVLGPEFENKRDYVILEGLKRALINYGIDVRCRTYKKDFSQVLIMLPIIYEHDKRYDKR